ncbi:hypothetical protein GCM10028805_28980 [Spirosoma harenae]
MKTLIDYPTATDTGVIGSRMDRIDPDIFRNEAGPAVDEEDGLDEDMADDEPDEELYDEPTDEDGDPTGEHDHHQDDNYALGGHVTRSSS